MEPRKIFGLPNLKNTCFINAGIQSVISCKSLRTEIANGDSSISHLFVEDEGFEKDKVKSCAELLIYYAKLNSEFIPGHSHDCSEFLTFLFDDLKTTSQKILYSTEVVNTKDESPPSTISTYDNILPLTMKESVHEGIVDFLIEETDSHIMRKSFVKIGDVLVISLKRFLGEFVDGQLKLSKITESVTVEDTINLTEDGHDVLLTLTSVIVHLGNIHDGHYISFQKIDNKWFLIDDSKVFLSETPDFQQAYILFYSKET